MSDNSTSNNGGGNDGPQNDTVNFVALVVSLVALLGTVAQVLQQYYASAAGYQNCGESVMGEWHKSKKRTFRWSEFRFEVQFESPVIFVCPPTNEKGPVQNQPIRFIRGTPDSLKETDTTFAKDENRRLMDLKNNQVHTADNERATWVTLLSHLQTMEQESSDWQLNQLKKFPPPSAAQKLTVAGMDKHTLVVAVQRKKRSWDTMPPDVRKPYATTTMCHLLEIAAMMGIYWKEFDRSKEKYRAEGNGYMLTGSNVQDLGLMFTFRITGKSHFGENRVIPVDEVKEMCCGSASTIFQQTKDSRRLEFPNEDSKDLAFLQLGSLAELAETMVQMECNTNTADYFLRPAPKYTHLFPVPFELLGMLGKTLHIRDSYYRMLPNPTPCHWDKNFFSIRRLLKEFHERIKEDEILCQEGQITELKELSREVVKTIGKDTKDAKVSGYSVFLLNTLHDALDKCDQYICAKERNRDLVQMVLREHFQEVLRMINDEEEDKGLADNASRKGDAESENKRATRFGELSSANPEERQHKFMDIYFYVVLHQVRERAVHSFLKRQGSTTYAPSIYAREDTPDHMAVTPSLQSVHTGTRAASAPSSPTLTATRPVSPPARLVSHRSSQSTPTPFLMLPQDSSVPQHLDVHDKTMDSELGREAAGIWCTLVFRMLCWLLLHDFHKKDVQIPKSELLGSRLPVYIA
ncbi:hypothetical protein V8F06_008740 [Rhypophila decipiens]